MICPVLHTEEVLRGGRNSLCQPWPSWIEVLADTKRLTTVLRACLEALSSSKSVGLHISPGPYVGSSWAYRLGLPSPISLRSVSSRPSAAEYSRS
jgi:hypothetical protein